MCVCLVVVGSRVAGEPKRFILFCGLSYGDLDVGPRRGFQREIIHNSQVLLLRPL